MIRYEIETTKPGIFIDTALVTRVCSTHARKVPTVIAFIDKKNQKAFEKYVEGHPDVVGYRSDPRTPNTPEKDWKKP